MKRLIVALLVLVAASSLAFMRGSEPPYQPTLHCTTEDSTTLTISEAIHFTISIGNVNEKRPLFGVQTFMTYDPAVLHFLEGEAVGDLFSVRLSPVLAPDANGILKMWQIVDIFNGDPDITAGGNLMTMEFQAVGVGETRIQFVCYPTEVGCDPCMATDRMGTPYECETFDGPCVTVSE